MEAEIINGKRELLMKDYNYQWKATIINGKRHYLLKTTIINKKLQLMKYNERLQISLKDTY